MCTHTHTLYGEYIYNHHKVNLKRENFFYPRSGISFLYSKIGTHSLWPGSRALQTCKLEEENFLLFNYARESRAFQSAGGLPYIKGSPSFCFMLKETKKKQCKTNVKFFLWVIFSTTSLKTAPWQYPPEVDGILERYFGFKMLIILKWCQNCSYLEEREREGERWKRSWVVGRIPNEAQQRSDTSKPVKNDDDATGQQAYPIPLEKFYFIPFNTRGSSSLFFSFSGRF